jgi:hypothetical protein
VLIDFDEVLHLEVAPPLCHLRQPHRPGQFNWTSGLARCQGVFGGGCPRGWWCPRGKRLSLWKVMRVIKSGMVNRTEQNRTNQNKVKQNQPRRGGWRTQTHPSSHERRTTHWRGNYTSWSPRPTSPARSDLWLLSSSTVRPALSYLPQSLSWPQAR